MPRHMRSTSWGRRVVGLWMYLFYLGVVGLLLMQKSASGVFVKHPKLRRALTLMEHLESSSSSSNANGNGSGTDKGNGTSNSNNTKFNNTQPDHYHSKVIADEYIVVMQPNVTQNAAQLGAELLRPYKGFAAVLRGYGGRRFLNGFHAKLSPMALVALLDDERVLYIEENMMYTLSSSSSFTRQFNARWGLDRLDQVALPLDGMYSYDHTGAGVDLFVIDSGVRLTHTQLAGRAVCNADLLNTTNQCADLTGHGTHVAGIAGSLLYGVAKQVTIQAIRICDARGSCTLSLMIAALQRVATATSKRVANLSITGTFSQAFADAVQATVMSGAVVVLAAGNRNSDACTTTSNTAYGISVGAVNQSDVQASFSNYGSCVHIWAPGVTILSLSNANDTATGTKDGTSMAAPHVAGAAALWLEQGYTASEVRSLLLTEAIHGTLTLTNASIAAASPNLLLHIPRDESMAPSASTTPSYQPSISAAPSASAAPSQPPTQSTSPSLRPSRHPTWEPTVPSPRPTTAPMPSLSCPANRIRRLCIKTMQCCPGYRCRNRKWWRLFMGACVVVAASAT